MSGKRQVEHEFLGMRKYRPKMVGNIDIQLGVAEVHIRFEFWLALEHDDLVEFA